MYTVTCFHNYCYFTYHIFIAYSHFLLNCEGIALFLSSFYWEWHACIECILINSTPNPFCLLLHHFSFPTSWALFFNPLSPHPAWLCVQDPLLAFQEHILENTQIFLCQEPSIASNSSARGWTLSDHTHTYMLRFGLIWSSMDREHGITDAVNSCEQWRYCAQQLQILFPCRCLWSPVLVERSLGISWFLFLLL